VLLKSIQPSDKVTNDQENLLQSNPPIIVNKFNTILPRKEGFIINKSPSPHAEEPMFKSQANQQSSTTIQNASRNFHSP